MRARLKPTSHAGCCSARRSQRSWKLTTFRKKPFSDASSAAIRRRLISASVSAAPSGASATLFPAAPSSLAFSKNKLSVGVHVRAKIREENDHGSDGGTRKWNRDLAQRASNRLQGRLAGIAVQHNVLHDHDGVVYY